VMLRGVGFVLGVLLSGAVVFALSDNGGQLLRPIMASVQSPFKETGIPAIQGLIEGKKNDDEAVVPNEALPDPPPGDTDTPQKIQARHFKLWSPFRSMRAAQGFADQLANVAGVSVDIQRTGSGRFQVMLLYLSEPERLASIDRIERLTGLKIQ